MPVVGVNGVSLHYEESGEGAPILCVHGTGSSGLAWAEAAPVLAEHGRTILYDRRGCFRSERPDPYDVTDVGQHADDAAALLDALHATPAVVVGRSYGGGVAIDLAHRYPEKVRALALVEAVVVSLLSDEARQWFADVDERTFAAAEADMGSVAEVFIGSVLGEGAWESFSAPAREMFTANGPAILAELRGGDLDIDTEALATISHPTLLVAGRDSPAALAEMTERMAAATPGARITWVAGGHLIDPAHPEILAFIDDVVTRA